MYHGLTRPKPVPSHINGTGLKEHTWIFNVSAAPVLQPWPQSGSKSSASSLPASPKGYMFPLRIPEQLTMCTAHFHQFLNLVNDWGFTGVEPYVYGTTMFGLRSSHANNPSGSVPFNMLFNASIHNNYLSKCMKRMSDTKKGYPILFEPVSEFLRHSYRKIVLVYFAGHRQSASIINSNIQEKVESQMNGDTGPFTDCSSAVQTHGMAKVVDNLLAKEVEIERASTPLLKEFKVTQAFCVKKGGKISLRGLRDFVLENIHREDGIIDASILFISWQGRFTHPLVDDEVPNYINKCRLLFSQPYHNDYILNAAKMYLNSLNLHEQPYLSVHVRFEKLYYFVVVEGNRGSLTRFLNCCMNRLNKVLSVVAEKFNITSPGNILLNWDYSPYGSMEYSIPHSSEVAQEQLKKVKATPVYFNPRKFDVPAQHSIVSLVEMNVLLNSSALVTVGGGSYQHTITQTFLERHRDSNNPSATEELHYGHLCIPPLETNLHGVPLPPQC